MELLLFVTSLETGSAGDYWTRGLMRDSETLRNLDSEEKETMQDYWLKGQLARTAFN
jgi:hypothetical protein